MHMRRTADEFLEKFLGMWSGNPSEIMGENYASERNSVSVHGEEGDQG